MMIIDKKSFLSDSYINNLLNSGFWVQHGSHLNDWLADCEDVPDLYVGGDVSQLKECPVFVEFFKDYLNCRFNYAYRLLIQDLGELSNSITLYRSAFLTPELAMIAATGEPVNLGKFWTVSGNCIPYGAETPEEGSPLVCFRACSSVPINKIDFIETMRSRMDYINGDYEQEIQLKENTHLVISSIE